MAEPLTARTFVKDDGDNTIIRHVYTPAEEVDAVYEGFTEQKRPPASTAGTASSSRSSSTRPSA